jgi:hypothetical protein
MSTATYFKLTYYVSPEQGYETIYCDGLVNLMSLVHERALGEFFVNTYEGECPEYFTSPTTLHYLKV